MSPSTPLYADYLARCATPSDIHEHLPALYQLATRSETIVEFGVRSGNSTIALLAGLEPMLGGRMYSYDLNPPAFPTPAPEAATWFFTQADTATLPGIPDCDLLFIDTLHTCDQVRAELQYADRVRRWIAFHDTQLFGTRDESPGTGPGIMHAIFEFLADHPEWQVQSHTPANNGLLVLARAAAS
jgi:cephalosporin hydroxylase